MQANRDDSAPPEAEQVGSGPRAQEEDDGSSDDGFSEYQCLSYNRSHVAVNDSNYVSVQTYFQGPVTVLKQMVVPGAGLELTASSAPKEVDPAPVDESADASAGADAGACTPRVLRVVPREHWLAQPPTKGRTKPLHTPVQYVIISHSAADHCSTIAGCSYLVRLIQGMHMEARGWVDIGYNFLVGGDGSAYEGRGWDAVGAHTLGWNNVSIGICFIGTFIADSAPERQQLAARMLIDTGVRLGKLRPDYRLVAQMQLRPTASPGLALYEDLKRWPQWHDEKFY